MRKGSKASPALRAKLSKAHLGYKMPDEQKQKIALALKGRKRSRADRLAMSRGRLGMKFTEEHRRNIGLAQKGRKTSEATKRKLSKALRGRVVTRATRTKIRKTLLGRQHTEERRRNESSSHIGKLRPLERGERHHNWKGGVSLHKLRGKPGQNQIWRLAVYERDGYKCQRCGAAGKKTWGIRGIGLDTCHIKPYKKFKKLRFVVDNGITLCRPCHIAFDVEERKRERR